MTARLEEDDLAAEAEVEVAARSARETPEELQFNHIRNLI
jgi:hypothetical protein